MENEGIGKRRVWNSDLGKARGARACCLSFGGQSLAGDTHRKVQHQAINAIVSVRIHSYEDTEKEVLDSV